MWDMANQIEKGLEFKQQPNKWGLAWKINADFEMHKCKDKGHRHIFSEFFYVQQGKVPGTFSNDRFVMKN